MRIDIYHHFDCTPSDELKHLISTILEEVNLLKEDIDTMTLSTQALKDAVTKETTVFQSVITLLTNLAAKVAELKQQLADAITANDPLKIAQVQAELDAMANDISTQADTLAAAVLANTPTV